MATDIFQAHGITLTRYCGPGDKPGPHRLRYQLTLTGTGSFVGELTIDQLAELVEAIADEPGWLG